MQQVERGFRGKLEAFINVNNALTVDISAAGGSTYDFSCFGVDAHNKLSDDRYMIFYNQLTSPNREISLNLQQGRALFDINLAALPGSIDKLVFTASIDGAGDMSQISRMGINIGQQGQTALGAELNGSYFSKEKAVIALEIYRKDVWRVSFVGQGFNGGLADLLKFYGGEEESSSAAPAQPAAAAPAPAPVPAAPPAPPAPAAPDVKVSLEKKLAKAPALVSLAKHVAVSLKKNNLENVVARVGLVLDASGSMDRSYRDGTVQEIVNRILPLAVQFDDDGQLDAWMFADRPIRMDSVNLENYTTVVPPYSGPVSVSSGGGGFFSMFSSKTSNTPQSTAGMTVKYLHDKVIGYCNDETKVMQEVINEYGSGTMPAYVVFISDGGVSDTQGITRMMIQASEMPIFWQFVGVRGSDYGILERLDDMQGRYIDNASFFALDDFKSVDKTELYNRLLSEFPAWLKEARAKGIVR